MNEPTMTEQTPSPDLKEDMYCDQLLNEMCEELCRLATDVRRQVRKERVLPALGSLTALEPLRNLLSRQLSTRLVHSGADTPLSDQGHVPGYL